METGRRRPASDPIYSAAPTMPVDHYENFPVASVLLPSPLREPVETIYAFARSADDIADEGDADADTRLASLDAYRRQLDGIARGARAADPMFDRLARAVHGWQLPLPLMHDLLDAFSQDVLKTRYRDFDDVLDYCRRSANPIGRLLLRLYRAESERNLRDSDAICSALQLINFWQDVAIDWQKGRIYLPSDSMARFGVDEAQLAEARVDAAWRALMAFEVARARQMILDGAPLARRLPGRIGWELRLVVEGGLRILERIEAVGYDVFRHRPTLGKADWARLVWRATTR